MPAFVFWLTEMAVVQGSACLSTLSALSQHHSEWSLSGP